MFLLVFGLSCSLLFSMCGKEEEKQDREPSRSSSLKTTKSSSKNLHIKYSPLLKEAAQTVHTKVFDRIRVRCDEQMMSWVENALDALNNNIPYAAQGAQSGMSAIKEVPKTPEGLIALAIDEKQVCGIPDYIRRVETTLDINHANHMSYTSSEEKEVASLITRMKEMLSELRAQF